MSSTISYPAGHDVAIIDGVVVPTGERQVSPTEVFRQIRNIVSLPYLGKEADMIGMTLLEAGIYAAAKAASEGDVDALNKLLDRLVGKPLQTVMSTTSTLKEFLDQVAHSEPVAVVDVDPMGE